jgi:hypothetical protein
MTEIDLFMSIFTVAFWSKLWKQKNCNKTQYKCSANHFQLLEKYQTPFQKVWRQHHAAHVLLYYIHTSDRWLVMTSLQLQFWKVSIKVKKKLSTVFFNVYCTYIVFYLPFDYGISFTAFYLVSIWIWKVNESNIFAYRTVRYLVGVNTYFVHVLNKKWSPIVNQF